MTRRDDAPRRLPGAPSLPGALRAGALALVMLGTSLGAYHLAQRIGLARLDRLLADRLTVTRHAVTTEVERLAYLPAALGLDARVAGLLAAPADRMRQAEANRYLETLRNLSGADEVYVLDPAGRTVAASNWNEPGSFVGQDYSFRPYYAQSMATGRGRTYAVGVTTGKPGYFLSARLGPAGHPAGVGVVKLDMQGLERTWAEANESVALADASGVVFLTGQSPWRYRPLAPLTAADRDRLAGARLYQGLDVVAAEPLSAEGRLTDATGAALRLARARIEPDGWELILGLPVAPVAATARLVAAVTALAVLLASVLAVIAAQRRQLVRLRLTQARELETRVAERTAELAHEIEVRKRAEEDLRRTHESLVHAAKLAALGRMSAAIVHEVSQPLSALDATLAAAELHVGRDDAARATRSLAAARGLLARMQKMVGHLKSFGARQRPAPPEPVDMAQVLAAAVEITEPRARELGLALTAEPAPALPPVPGQAVQLEQVAVNLVLNALEATAAAGGARVVIRLGRDGDRLAMTVTDEGPGLTPARAAEICEPFVTGRPGEGLGLGLAIVRSILDHCGGRLAFAPASGGGTRATVTLPFVATPVPS
ncbi:sensor histidine kinase [Frigidibacter sp. MR17.24]|uniref:sensor histidine kinase n=1 Tax=Frigidibacter sp. MR17.24 TaxID=3127345 RepID=UPI0030131AD2